MVNLVIWTSKLKAVSTIKWDSAILYSEKGIEISHDADVIMVKGAVVNRPIRGTSIRCRAYKSIRNFTVCKFYLTPILGCDT